MEFCYACVIRGDVPLVQHCPLAGNFDLFFQKYAEKNKIEVGKTTVISDGYYWGILAEPSGLTFVCVVKNIRDQELLNRALDDIRSRFLRVHGSEWKTAPSYGLQSTFEQQLIAVKDTIRSVCMAQESGRRNSAALDADGAQLEHQNMFFNKDEIDGLEVVPLSDDRLSKHQKLALGVGAVLAVVLVVALAILFTQK